MSQHRFSPVGIAFFTLSCLFVANVALAVEPAADAVTELNPFNAGVRVGEELWGFMDSGGRVVVEPEYASASDFDAAGFSLVLHEHLYGYVGSDGEPAIMPKYSHAFPFAANGLACVMPDSHGKFGFIDREGKMVIPPEYETPSIFAANGLAPVAKDGKFGFIDVTGAERIPFIYDSATAFSEPENLAGVLVGDKWGFVAADGNMVIEPKFHEIGEFRLGLCPVRFDGLYGYIDAKGEFAIPNRFASAGMFASNGLALVAISTPPPDGQGVRLVHQYGYLKTDGAFAIEPQYSFALDFSSTGFAAVIKDGKWGAINERNEMIVPPAYDNASLRDGELDLSTKVFYGTVGSDGVVYTDNRRFKNGVSVVVRDDKGGYFSKNGEKILDVEIVGGLTVIRALDGELLFPSQTVLDNIGVWAPPL